MAAAPMKYGDDGSVDWGNMWESFCALAQEGGPPHRATMLAGAPPAEDELTHYDAVCAEIARGIAAVSGLRAAAAEPGWIAVSCPTAGMAGWLAEAIVAEHVAARHTGKQLFVPAAASYGVAGEVKSVITAVAKTTHYWHDHLPPPIKQALVVQERLDGLTHAIGRLFGRIPTS